MPPLIKKIMLTDGSTLYIGLKANTTSQPIRIYVMTEAARNLLANTEYSVTPVIASAQIMPNNVQPSTPFSDARQKGVYVPAMST